MVVILVCLWEEVSAGSSYSAIVATSHTSIFITMAFYLCAQPDTHQRQLQKVTKSLHYFSKFFSSDILGLFFSFSAFKIRVASKAVFSIGEKGDVIMYQIGVPNKNWINHRLYIPTFGATIWQDQPFSIGKAHLP